MVTWTSRTFLNFSVRFIASLAWAAAADTSCRASVDVKKNYIIIKIYKIIFHVKMFINKIFHFAKWAHYGTWHYSPFTSHFWNLIALTVLKSNLKKDHWFQNAKRSIRESVQIFLAISLHVQYFDMLQNSSLTAKIGQQGKLGYWLFLIHVISFFNKQGRSGPTL